MPAWISNHMPRKVWVKLFIHSQTSTVAPLKFGNWKIIPPTLYNGCSSLSMLGLKLIHVSKRALRRNLRACNGAPMDAPYFKAPNTKISSNREVAFHFGKPFNSAVGIVLWRRWDRFVGTSNPPHWDIWWRHAVEMLSALLAICEVNLPATYGFPSQKASYVQILCCLLLSY